MIGGYLMPDLSRNLVHLRWLLKLVDFRTPYEDPEIRAVIPDEFFQNPNIWHMLNDEHKIDLRQSNMNWPIFWSEYIKMWENWYDHIPTREPTIVLELACALDYIPWFKIHGKPYLLLEEQRRWQMRVEREQRGPLKPKRRDDDMGPSTVPTQSPSPTPQQTTLTLQPLQIMP
ncbi:hypothetical protein Gotri_007786, partial [Gossypium trilobum]|nr:hypothetical protein [Gossypium trilobum]